MNEKSEAVKHCILHILGDNGEAGHELLVEQWPDGRVANLMYERIETSPELTAIDDFCRCVSGELARHSDCSELELKEAGNIARLLASQSDRLVEIGQENEHDGLIVIGATLESLGQSIDALLQHHARKD